ncbi:receptor kinase-like protein Xa21 [Rosa sericea]
MLTMLMQRILLLSGVVLLHYSCLLHLAISSSNLTDQSALLAIQSKLTFDPTNTVLGGNWTTETSFCNWFGVSCSKRRQRVTALKLPYMGLQGTISPHIGNLSFLVLLDLQNNSFTGSLPHEISRLHRLRILVVQVNQLEGTIPPALQHCQKLQTLSLSYNRLSGRIPKELGFLPKLQKLYLGVNNFVAGNIPVSLGNISTLQELSLPETGLTGSFPHTLLNLSSLVLISLYKNNISGSLHDVDICHYWPNIQILQFANNKFSGKLPSRIDRCREIVVLSLSNNRLIGSIPPGIGALQNLEELHLDFNSLTGFIPPTIGNLSNLKQFLVQGNNITGSIPKDLGRLSNLQRLGLANNSLTGAIPFDIFNISSLHFFTAAFNSLSGTFPSSTGILLPNIEGLYLSANQFTGAIPAYFSNFSKLHLLDLSQNLLYGAIPMSLGSIQNLRILNLGRNQLSGEPGVLELRFLSSIFNSSSLRVLALDDNPLNGIMPDSFRNQSYSFQNIYAPRCQIKGHIPSSIGFLKNLTSLVLLNNNMTGNLPSSIGGLEMMHRLYLDSNNIEGLIPDELCLLRNLGELLLSNNNFSGVIPSCIANLEGLQKVLLNSNRLTSTVPINLWNLENLVFLDLSFNSLSGDLPSSMRKTKVLQMIDLSSNQISGNIPTVIGEFQSLSSLNLSNNMFVGSVPQSFGDLKGLEILDLSYNTLSGTIPKSLETLKYLKYLNLSYNKLSGEIPSEGPFVNFSAQSFLGNMALCQRSPNFGVSPCRNPRARKSSKVYSLLKYIFPAIISTAILTSLISWWKICQKRKATIPRPAEQLIAPDHIMISYRDLCLATNDFCESNLLGVGSFGSVYKGVLSDGTIVAVKVLDLKMEGAIKSFDAECKVWRTIRHRNVVKVITTCSSPDVRALVLEYMSHGSLEKWLYSHNYCLSLLQRVSVLIDIASALEYLHHGQSEVVVHCDLKPSNILLDEDMVAHVADFGLGKVLAENKEETQTRTLGTLGYIAPEYGSEGKVSAKGDIYSFGIMLFEILTRKKPTDELFFGELTLRQWINASIPERVIKVVDNGLLSIEGERDFNFLESIVLHIMELGLECTLESPEERVDIKEVVSKLNKIKLALFHDRTVCV